MEARGRVLEEIAARQDRRLDDRFAELRWRLGLILGLSGAGPAIIAHGFH
jgi:hypothetical protein